MANQLTVFLDPTKMPNQSQAQATFDANMAALFANLPTFGAQFNAGISAYNAAAAGSAYAIPYTVDLSSTTDTDPGNGTLRFDNATQNAATTLRLDLLNNLGGNVAAILDTFDASTSAVKGTIRLVKMGDATAFLMFSVTARTAPTGYRDISVTPIASSANNPFGQGDAVLLHFTRTGDKGDTSSFFPSMYARCELSQGSQDNTIGTTWTTRFLNTVKYNSISGASLASNAVTLPAGTYLIEATAPAITANGHRCRLYNATDSTTVEYGTSEYTSQTYPSMTRSIVRVFYTVPTGATKAIRLEHIATATGGYGGPGMNVAGVAEVYSEMKIMKVA